MIAVIGGSGLYEAGWLARALGLCYASLSLITDLDVGLNGVEEQARAG